MLHIFIENLLWSFFRLFLLQKNAKKDHAEINHLIRIWVIPIILRKTQYKNNQIFDRKGNSVMNCYLKLPKIPHNRDHLVLCHLLIFKVIYVHLLIIHWYSFLLEIQNLSKVYDLSKIDDSSLWFESCEQKLH